jgi:hypothetical protein
MFQKRLRAYTALGFACETAPAAPVEVTREPEGEGA